MGDLGGGWKIVGAEQPATPPPASSDLGGGWKLVGSTAAAPASPAVVATSTAGAPPLPKGLTKPDWKPGAELPEDEPGDIETGGAYWDTSQQNELAKKYNQQLDQRSEERRVGKE